MKSFEDARQMYAMASFMREDLPDGMWDDVKDIALDYRESDKTEDDKQAFAEDLGSVFNEYGFSF